LVDKNTHDASLFARRQYLQGRLSFETGLNDLTMLGVLGFNHLQMYSLEALHPAELDQVLHICETYNMHFGWSLTGQTLQLVNETRGFNSSTYWEDILTSMNRIKAHPNLLGWYVCDDCGGGEYPLDSLHKVYNELKVSERSERIERAKPSLLFCCFGQPPNNFFAQKDAPGQTRHRVQF